MRHFIILLLCCIAPAVTLRAEEDPTLALGRQTFQICVTCHGPDGKGLMLGDLLAAPSLTESPYVKGDHADLLAAILLKGVMKEDNKYVQAMLPLEAVFNDAQLAAVIAFVTSEFGGKRQPVSDKKVAEWRKEFAGQTSPWKRSDLAELLKTAEAPPLLTDLTYSLYEGKWDKLPDFSTLTPVETGEVENDIISLDPASKKKNGVAMVFEGRLSIPHTGDYQFALASDDGSALVIDGETVVGNDGIHPIKSVGMKETLEAGDHRIKVLYFDGGGQRALALSVKQEKLGTVLLSKDKIDGKKEKSSYAPILLKPENPGEAIVHRAFLPDSHPRAIGVGYPDGLNLVWDADVLNVAYLYQGEFMNAANHWNGRGSGSEPGSPERAKIAPGLPFQTLASLDQPWVNDATLKVPYERDTAEPTKEITVVVRPEGYQFEGYRLDAKRFPTFRYRFGDLEVTDRFDPAAFDDKKGFTRTITMTGKASENTYFRLASTGEQKPAADGWISIGSDLSLKIEGAEPITRETSTGKETLLPVSGDGTVKISYRWSK
jgi:mono/diheme cytochrome c family protein